MTLNTGYRFIFISHQELCNKYCVIVINNVLDLERVLDNINAFLILNVLFKKFRSVPLQIIPTFLRTRSMRSFFYFRTMGSFLIFLVKERSFPRNDTQPLSLLTLIADELHLDWYSSGSSLTSTAFTTYKVVISAWVSVCLFVGS